MKPDQYLDMVEALNPKSKKYSEDLAEVIYQLAKMMNDQQYDLVDSIFDGTSPSVLCTDYVIQSVSVISNRKENLSSWMRWRNLCWGVISSRLSEVESRRIWESFMKE
jgi:hypothetical protein